MLSLLTGLLMALLVLDCIVLTFLVLIQLPKKEAGLGTAFGSTATDALFGAGTGTALTQMTKYASGIFFGITIILAVIGSYNYKERGGTDRLKRAIEQAAKVLPVAPTTPAPTATTPDAPAPAAAAPLALQITNAATVATNAARTAAVPVIRLTNPAPATPATK